MDPNREMAQYVRDRWGIDKGLPGGVHAIAQTNDGYLWSALKEDFSASTDSASFLQRTRVHHRYRL